MRAHHPAETHTAFPLQAGEIHLTMQTLYEQCRVIPLLLQQLADGEVRRRKANSLASWRVLIEAMSSA